MLIPIEKGMLFCCLNFPAIGKDSGRRKTNFVTIVRSIFDPGNGNYLSGFSNALSRLPAALTWHHAVIQKTRASHYQQTTKWVGNCNAFYWVHKNFQKSVKTNLTSSIAQDQCFNITRTKIIEEQIV